MKRDDDLIRELLFKYEAEDDWLQMMAGDVSGASEEERREGYHIHLMMDEGLLTPVGRSTFRITSFGHDYLQAIRNDTIWNKTKEGAAKVGGMTLGMMIDLAIGYLKQEAAEKLGIQP